MVNCWSGIFAEVSTSAYVLPCYWFIVSVILIFVDSTLRSLSPDFIAFSIPWLHDCRLVINISKLSRMMHISRFSSLLNIFPVSDIKRCAYSTMYRLRWFFK